MTVRAPRPGNAAVWAVASAAVLGTLMQTLFVPVLHVLPDRLGAAPADVSWLITAALVSGVVSCAVLGRLADMYGRRRILLVALTIFVLGSVLGALTSELPVLLLCRALQGTSMAALPIGIGVLTNMLDGAARVRGMARITAVSSVGVTAGAVAGGAIAELFDWRLLFVGSAVAGVLVIAAVARCLPADPVSTRQRFDLLGALGLALGLVVLLVGVSRGSTWGWSSPLTVGFVSAGVVALGTWSCYEWQTRDPLVDLRVLASRAVLLVNVVTLMVGFGMYGIVLVGPQLAQLPEGTTHGLGASMLGAGMLFLPATAVVIATPFVATRVVRHRGALTTLAFGVGLLATAYTALTLWHSSLAALTTGIAVVFAGVGLCFSAIPLLLAEHVAAQCGAEANGVNGVFRIVGTSLSSATITAILTAATADGVPTDTAFVVAFVVCGAVSLAALPPLAAARR